MLSYIWAAMIIISFIFGFFNNNIDAVTNAAFSGCSDSVNVVISLLGIMCFWSGLMEIAKRSGLTKKIAKILYPAISRLFPELSPKSDAMSAISLNIIANLLGLSNAATPLGLKAMEELKKESKYDSRASHSMCRFVLINTASVTLVPSTVIALRSATGSLFPAEIILPTWIASISALTVGIVASKILSKKDL